MTTSGARGAKPTSSHVILYSVCYHNVHFNYVIVYIYLLELLLAELHYSVV